MKGASSLTQELSELAAATAYAEAWNTLDCYTFARLLSPNAKYASQYVFDEIAGRDAIRDYLCAKFKAVKDTGGMVKAVVATATTSFPGKPCVLLIQNSTDAVIVFETEEKHVRRLDLCITQIYTPVPVDDNVNLHSPPRSKSDT